MVIASNIKCFKYFFVKIFTLYENNKSDIVSEVYGNYICHCFRFHLIVDKKIKI